MSDRLLWADFETNGLLYKHRHTALEVAWTITDMTLEQLCPLRTLMIDWRPPTSPEMHAPVPGDEDWETSAFVAQVVRDMHDLSGLTAEWPDRVHVEAGSVEDLINNDLGVTNTGAGAVYLAGAGVSHFDQGLVALHMPSLAPKDAGGRLHYRCFDVSVASLVLGIDLSVVLGAPEHLWKISGAVPTIEGLLDVGQARPHRAAADVATSLVQARALRWKTGLDSPIQLG
jgi:oligoribonuclease (3'-5' exoribonuclease)